MAVYYFNATDSSITECLFVEAKQNYELLKRDVEDLNYISTDRNYFYVCVDGSVYGIDFADPPGGGSGFRLKEALWFLQNRPVFCLDREHLRCFRPYDPGS